jgi:hypothetical protein
MGRYSEDIQAYVWKNMSRQPHRFDGQGNLRNRAPPRYQARL